MNTVAAPKVCSLTGKIAEPVESKLDASKLPNLVSQTPSVELKVCSASGKRLAAESDGPNIPALEAPFWDHRYSGKEFVWTADANQFLVSEVAGLKPGTAIDMAAGEGRNALWLASQGWYVRAVDFSAVAMEKAQRLAERRGLDMQVAFETVDLRQFEPPAQTFNLVAFVYLQIPLGELLPILRRASKAVAPRGTLLFIAHDLDNMSRGFGGPQHPEMLYTVQEVVDGLGNELVIEKARQVERRIKTADGEKVAIDLVVRATRA